MSNTVHVKLEKDNLDMEYCGICFSIDRDLTQMKHLSVIYEKLLNSFQYTNTYSSMLICWECRHILQKWVQFQNKVITSNNIIKQQAQDNIAQNPLSTLTKVFIADNSYKVINYEEKQIKLETTEIDDNLYSDIDDIGGEINIENVASEKIQTKKEICPQKRTLSNGKYNYKFEILKKSDVSNLYFKLRINEEEIGDLVASEKNNEFFVGEKYKCENCLRGFKKESLFLKHMRIFHEKSKTTLICKICDASLSTTKQLNVHLDDHKHKYECTLCTYVSYKKHHIQSHIINAHNLICVCEICGKKFCNKNEFLEHHKLMHELFICDYCGDSFAKRLWLETHIRTKHSPVVCEICSRRFTRYTSLWLHKKMKHNTQNQEKSYCVECNKYFNNIYSYKWHLNNTVRHKPRKKCSYPCLGCNKVFTKSTYMKEHYDLVHLKKFKFHCEQCDKNFIRNADLQKHIRRKHEGVVTPKNKVCYICGRRFTTNMILNNHIRTHTGERPFQCSHCTAKFTQKTSLNTHIKLVHLKIKKQKDVKWND